jgi:4a-hydroxytetrahydrobiopterin dehydratase
VAEGTRLTIRKASSKARNREAEMSEWQQEGEAIVREWKFKDFAEALGFVNRVGALAEEAGHHPDILLHGWNKVRLTLSTHSEGRVTDADRALARKIDEMS